MTYVEDIGFPSVASDNSIACNVSVTFPTQSVCRGSSSTGDVTTTASSDVVRLDNSLFLG